MNLTLHIDMPDHDGVSRREEQSFVGEYKAPITFVRAANVEKSKLTKTTGLIFLFSQRYLRTSENGEPSLQKRCHNYFIIIDFLIYNFF